MSASALRSPARTSPLPRVSNVAFFGPSPWSLKRTCFRLRMISVHVLDHARRVENSCSTPSICTAVTAAPCSDDSSTRRSAFPSVRPKPRSSGSIDEPAVAVGRGLVVEHDVLRHLQILPLHVSALPRGPTVLLRVELDDELLVDRSECSRASGYASTRPAELLGVEARATRASSRGPCAPRATPGSPPGPCCSARDADLVADAHLERRDVHDLAVHREVAVAHQLARGDRDGAKPSRNTTLSSRRSSMQQQVLAGDALGARAFAK